MTEAQRKRLEQSLSHLIGLELWLIGELDLANADLLHHFSSIQARMSVVQAIAWPSDDDSAEEEAAFAGEL